MDGDDINIHICAPVNRVDLNQPSRVHIAAHIGGHNQEGRLALDVWSVTGRWE